MNIKFLHPGARQPTYGTDGAGAFDLYAAEDAIVWDGEAVKVDTGLAFEVPAGQVMLVFPRSGLAVTHGIRLANAVAVIDSDYRGSVQVPLVSDQPTESGYVICAGDRIAQAMLVASERITFNIVDTLSATARGEGSFGSTGTC